MNYPPFCDIILVRIHGSSLEKVKEISQELYRLLIKYRNNNLLIYKPIPSPIDKIQNVYRWRIVIKGRLNKNAVDIINKVLNDVQNKRDKNVSIVVDSNPSNMM